MGPTGSGKSTLVSLIPRIYDPTEGEILLDGIPLRDTDPEELRDLIGMVLQDTFLFSDTIEANIALGLDDRSDPAVQEAAEVAQIHGAILAFPTGIPLFSEKGASTFPEDRNSGLPWPGPWPGIRPS